MTTLLERIGSAIPDDIENSVNTLSIRTVLLAVLVLVVLLVISMQVVKRKHLHGLKTPLFVAIAATILLPTFLLMGSTVYINTISDSKGPVHWHTDIEFWVCNQEIELRDPSGFLSNKVGTATYHEHDDKRIHLEGVVVEKEYDASLDKFMTVTGGSISKDAINIPTERQLIEDDVDGDWFEANTTVLQPFVQQDKAGKPLLALQNGARCGTSTIPAELQVFLFRYDKKTDTYTQTKLANPASYVLRDESVVPPGDCVIVEFDTPKERTTRLCQQYGVRDSERCTQFGVSEYNPKLCNIRQLSTTGGTE